MITCKRGHVGQRNTERRECQLCRKARSRWRSMIRRCYDPAHDSYPNYGARGIAVCPEWRESFDAYYAVVGDAPFDGATVDRIDNDGDYEPGNVQWSTWVEQNRNQRNAPGLRTHCPQRHEYTPENTRVSKGKRYCRTCGRDSDRRRYHASAA